MLFITYASYKRSFNTEGRQYNTTQRLPGKYIYTIDTDTRQTECLLVGDTSMKGGVVTKGVKGEGMC